VRSSQVRDLARRYATGKLSQESYRSQRRALIDAITGGGVQLSYRNDERKAVRSGSRAKLLAVAAGGVIIVCIIAVVLLKRWSHAHGQGAAQAATVAATPVAAPTAPGPDLVRAFVEADDWTDSSLQSFERRWQGLGAEEQAKAKDSPMYGRLLSEVRQQVDSEKAVAGDSGSGVHLMELQKLAKTLGANAP
jgi:hypothetical protein